MARKHTTIGIIGVCFLTCLAAAQSPGRSLKVIVSAKDTGDRFSVKDGVPLSSARPAPGAAALIIDETKTYQTIVGFGGSFTEAAAFALTKVSPDKRQEALKAYFDPVSGLGYTLCRTHINSCDFSLSNYSYCRVEGDTELKHFDIGPDKRFLIPLIQDALAVPNANFKIFASPWSPPGWMKTNGQMNHGGQLKPEYRDPWALYYARYIQAYKQEGIEIWGLTVQNEPAAVQTWDSCIWSAEEEGQFVRDHLGPTLAKQGLGHIKIMIWDHNKDIIFERVKPILSDPQAAQYVWGVGFHWYSGDQFENLDKVHRAFPDKHLLFTEGCQEGGVHLGSWNLAERYAHDILGDLNNWTVGWVDWNMVLDENGGPNHVGNFCDAPILADSKNNKLIYQSSYYALGHFSKYIRPGAVRIQSTLKNCSLETAVFKNTDGRIAAVVFNRTDQAVPLQVVLPDGAGQVTSAPRSIMTVLYDGKKTRDIRPAL